MAVIIVSVVIIGTKRVIFRKICNFFVMIVSNVINAIRGVFFPNSSTIFFVMVVIIVSIVIIAIRGVIFQNSSTFFL